MPLSLPPRRMVMVPPLLIFTFLASTLWLIFTSTLLVMLVGAGSRPFQVDATSHKPSLSELNKVVLVAEATEKGRIIKITANAITVRKWECSESKAAAGNFFMIGNLEVKWLNSSGLRKMK